MKMGGQKSGLKMGGFRPKQESWNLCIPNLNGFLQFSNKNQTWFISTITSNSSNFLVQPCLLSTQIITLQLLNFKQKKYLLCYCYQILHMLMTISLSLSHIEFYINVFMETKQKLNES